MGVTSLGKDHTWEINLAARAAWMSYVGEKTQSEIAKSLGVSSARVHRLIQLAKHQGIVRIHIEGRPAECLGLETEIAAQYGLRSCTISPYLTRNEDSAVLHLASVGQAAGQLLAQHMMQPQVKSVTIGTGSALRAAIEAMPLVPQPELAIYPATGCLSQDLQSSALEALTLIERRTGARVHQIPAPFMPSTSSQVVEFRALGPIKQLLKSAAKSELMVTSLQKVSAKSGLIDDGLVSASQVDTLLEFGAIVELFGIFFDAQGQPISNRSAPEAIGLDCDVLFSQVEQKKSRTIVIAAEQDCVPELRAALSTGLITDIVMHESLATSLMLEADLRCDAENR